ncbi:MAG: 2-amino-4-hydroxy-6-hydroxymethyldihydropteridine diphosphokinase [Pseudomonadota bacterium]
MECHLAGNTASCNAYIGFGGNVGDVLTTLHRAVIAFHQTPGIVAVRLSSLWETAAVGGIPQPPFLNACAELRIAPGSKHTPRTLLARLLDTERALGRDRTREIPDGPRPIDLDLLLFGNLEVNDPGPPAVFLPHPRLHRRAFVLAPLVELVGSDFVLPGKPGGRAGDLLAIALTDPDQTISRLS